MIGFKEYILQEQLDLGRRSQAKPIRGLLDVKRSVKSKKEFDRIVIPQVVLAFKEALSLDKTVADSNIDISAFDQKKVIADLVRIIGKNNPPFPDNRKELGIKSLEIDTIKFSKAKLGWKKDSRISVTFLFIVPMSETEVRYSPEYDEDEERTEDAVHTFMIEYVTTSKGNSIRGVGYD